MRNPITLSLTAGAVAFGALAPLAAANAADMSMAPPYQPPPQAQYAPPPAYGPPPVEEGYAYPPPRRPITRRRPSPITAMPPRPITSRPTITAAAAIGAATARALLMATGAGIGGGELRHRERVEGGRSVPRLTSSLRRRSRGHSAIGLRSARIRWRLRPPQRLLSPPLNCHGIGFIEELAE